MKKLILAITLMSFTQVAFASFLIEPFYGMSFSGEVENGSNFEESYSGSSLGARLGWQSMGLQLGIDYRMTTLDIDEVSEDLEKTDISAFIGYEFPILVRAYAAVQISGDGSIDDTDYLGGKQTIIGFGYTGLPFIAINFEMVSWSYDEYDAPSGDGDTDLEGSHSLLSISFPFTI
jgi:hypothetical protein